MTDINQDTDWNEIRSLWKDSTRYAAIRIEIEGLIKEFKSKVSPFEKQAVRNDIDFIKRHTGEFEKNSIKRDLELIKRPLMKLLRKFLKD